jgi:hypothetical protein
MSWRLHHLRLFRLLAGAICIWLAASALPHSGTARAQSAIELMMQKQGVPTAAPRSRSSRVVIRDGRRAQRTQSRGLFNFLSSGDRPRVRIVQPRAASNRIELDESSSMGFFLSQQRRRERPRAQEVDPSALLFLPDEGRAAERKSRRREAAKIIRLDGDDSEPSAHGERSFCVRLCDGFFFPVGASGAGDNTEAHQLSCNAQCPFAETKIYVAPPGAEGIAEASHGGVNYSRLPTAFAYREKLDKSCSCNGKTATGLVRMPVLADFTLERGDIVMTPDGLKVLAARRYPYVEKSFVPADWSKGLSARERDGLRGLESGGRNGRITERDRKNADRANAVVERLLEGGEAAAQDDDAQSLVRRIGPNPVEAESLGYATDADCAVTAEGAEPSRIARDCAAN